MPCHAKAVWAELTVTTQSENRDMYDVAVNVRNLPVIEGARGI